MVALHEQVSSAWPHTTVCQLAAMAQHIPVLEHRDARLGADTAAARTHHHGGLQYLKPRSCQPAAHEYPAPHAHLCQLLYSQTHLGAATMDQLLSTPCATCPPAATSSNPPRRAQGFAGGFPLAFKGGKFPSWERPMTDLPLSLR